MSIKLEGCDLQIGYEKVISSGSFSIGDGNLIGLVGNNGVGKTTLLRTISGFIKPISGEVLVAGISLMSYKKAELSRIISVVTTTNPDVALLSVEETVALGRFPYTNQMGILSTEDWDMVGNSMEQCGVYSLRKKMLNQLSDGERQKVFLAKSIAQDTKILLLDEPSSFLDFSSKNKLFYLLQKIALEENKLILISSHDIPTLLDYAHSFLLMTEGEEWKEVSESAYILNWIKSQK